jgi:Na+-driven multidrug efflux pump
MWTVFEGWGTAVGVFLNGTNVVKPQVVLNLIFAPLCVLGKIFLVNYLFTSGIPIAASVVYLCTIMLPYLYLFRKKLIRAG